MSLEGSLLCKCGAKMASRSSFPRDLSGLLERRAARPNSAKHAIQKWKGYAEGDVARGQNQDQVFCFRMHHTTWVAQRVVPAKPGAFRLQNTTLWDFKTRCHCTAKPDAIGLQKSMPLCCKT